MLLRVAVMANTLVTPTEAFLSRVQSLGQIGLEQAIYVELQLCTCVSVATTARNEVLNSRSVFPHFQGSEAHFRQGVRYKPGDPC